MHLPTQLPQAAHEVRHRITGVEAAWTGQDPHPGSLEAPRLLAERCVRGAKGMAIGAKAKEGDEARPVAAQLAREARLAGDEFRRRELIGAGGGAPYKVGESIAQLQQQLLFGRMQQAGREPCGMQGRPEAVAGAREVVAGRRRIEAGIDAAEKDLEAGRDDIAQRLCTSRLEIPCARPA